MRRPDRERTLTDLAALGACALVVAVEYPWWAIAAVVVFAAVRAAFAIVSDN